MNTTVTHKRSQRLTPENICAIIKACGEAGVRKLRYCELELNFTDDNQNIIRTIPEEFVREAKTKAEIVSREETVNERLEQLAIEDPRAYEEFMDDEDSAMEGDFEDRGTEPAV